MVELKYKNIIMWCNMNIGHEHSIFKGDVISDTLSYVRQPEIYQWRLLLPVEETFCFHANSKIGFFASLCLQDEIKADKCHLMFKISIKFSAPMTESQFC